MLNYSFKTRFIGKYSNVSFLGAVIDRIEKTCNVPMKTCYFGLTSWISCLMLAPKDLKMSVLSKQSFFNYISHYISMDGSFLLSNNNSVN